jgi:GTPase SAR1 family protein
MMEWDEWMATRFDTLRLKEINGDLTPQEQAELNQLIQNLEAEEAQMLAAFFEHKQKEQKVLREKLEGMQQENEELAKLISQQEQLAAV